MTRYALAWLPMVIIAVGNGALRELGYAPQMGELAAHQLSTLSGALLLGVYMGAVIRRWPPRSAGQAWGVGLLWLALTLAFEFLVMGWAAGKSWAETLRDYDLAGGRVWAALLLWIAAAPYLLRRLLGRRGQ